MSTHVRDFALHALTFYIGPLESLVANGVGGQAPAGTAVTCCDPLGVAHVMSGQRHEKTEVRPASLKL
jgi:hypothetical protein